MEHLTMHTFVDSTSSNNNLLIWSVVSAMYTSSCAPATQVPISLCCPQLEVDTIHNSRNLYFESPLLQHCTSEEVRHVRYSSSNQPLITDNYPPTLNVIAEANCLSCSAPVVPPLTAHLHTNSQFEGCIMIFTHPHSLAHISDTCTVLCLLRNPHTLTHCPGGVSTTAVLSSAHKVSVSLMNQPPFLGKTV